MSTYDDASLILYPSGYKEDKLYSLKPTDGSGDLTFTRASSATRVASNGLIEKVRTNLVTYSNTFTNAAWTKVGGTTLTAGQSDYLGGTNAWKWEATGASTIQLAQNPAGTTLRTASIYAKAGSISALNLWIGSAVIFNLSTGTITSGTGVITSVGNGWYRCSAFGTSLSYNPYFTAATAGDYVLISFAQMDESDIATDYIPTTTTAVSVGPVSGLPRIDYTGGGCGKLLLEKQSTNLFTYSEQFDNAAWTKYGGQSITANATTSPDGTQNADKMIDAGGIYALSTFTASTAYSLSVFIKKDTATSFDFGYIDQSTPSYVGGAITYTFSTGAIVVSQSANSSVSGQAFDFGNGWIRLVIKFITSATKTYDYQYFEFNGGDAFIYGAQLEASSYPTSYIPTTSTSVTRVADSASKTGISSLIGQTEGVFFADYNYTQHGANLEVVMSLQGATTQSYFEMYHNNNLLKANIYNSGSVQAGYTSSTQASGRYKVAFAYKANDFAMYINGTQVMTDSSGTVPTLSNWAIGYDFASNSYQIGNSINSAMLFTTRLTNAELATLTTL